MTFLTLFAISSLVAFISLIWKETVNTFPVIKHTIKKYLSVLARKPLFCGFCFTSWIAFFTTIVVYHALRQNFFTTWAMLAISALIIRSVIIALEELVHWEVHTLNGQPDDIH